MTDHNTPIKLSQSNAKTGPIFAAAGGNKMTLERHLQAALVSKYRYHHDGPLGFVMRPKIIQPWEARKHQATVEGADEVLARGGYMPPPVSSKWWQGNTNVESPFATPPRWFAGMDRGLTTEQDPFGTRSTKGEKTKILDDQKELIATLKMELRDRDHFVDLLEKQLQNRDESIELLKKELRDRDESIRVLQAKFGGLAPQTIRSQLQASVEDCEE